MAGAWAELCLLRSDSYCLYQLTVLFKKDEVLTVRMELRTQHKAADLEPPEQELERWH